MLSFKGSDTVGTLIDTIRERLKYEHMIGVCSKDGYYTLDYYLQHRDNRLAGIHNNQCLDIIFEGIVADYSTPTLADLEFLACVGEGISAAVYLVRHCSNGRLYALKMIKKEYFREYKTLESVLREKKILSEMINDMPFVTHLEAAFESYRHLNFLLEFYPGGEFFYHLSQMKLSEDQAKIFFAEILLTMEQLHKRKILYRDLKVLPPLCSPRISWSISKVICTWGTSASAGSISRGRIWLIPSAAVRNIWLTKPEKLWGTATRLISTRWERSSTKW